MKMNASMKARRPSRWKITAQGYRSATSTSKMMKMSATT